MGWALAALAAVRMGPVDSQISQLRRHAAESRIQQLVAVPQKAYGACTHVSDSARQLRASKLSQAGSRKQMQGRTEH